MRIRRPSTCRASSGCISSIGFTKSRWRTGISSIVHGSARRLLWSAAGIVLVALALTGVADDRGREYASDALTRTLVTFAIARTLDGAISVAQGTALAVEPAGVGVSLTVGQVLDPINDLVERFSAVMLVAATSVGAQNLLLRISGWWGLSWLLVSVVVASLAALWAPRLAGGKLEQFVLKLLLIVAFVRFSVPALLICSDLVFHTFLAEEQSAATEMLEVTRVEIEQFNEETAPDTAAQDLSLSERLGAAIDSSLRAMNVRERVEQLQQRISGAVEQIVNLIVLFVLETILLPLLFVAMFVALLKSVGVRMLGLQQR